MAARLGEARPIRRRARSLECESHDSLVPSSDTSGSACEAQTTVPALPNTEPRPRTQREAKRAARDEVFGSARDLVRKLVAKGDYQATKFLFEFAGLMPSADEEEESSPEYHALVQKLIGGPNPGESIQTPEAKLNLSTDAGTLSADDSKGPVQA